VTPARLLVVIAVAVFLLAAAVRMMGDQWAERGTGDWDRPAAAVAGLGVLLLGGAAYASRQRR
jgi:NADH:ubiquinone oxidoreductase subunit 6 (subunit J)